MNLHALAINRCDGPPEWAGIAVHQPVAGALRLSMAASGLNPLDIRIRAGAAAHANHPLLALVIDMAAVVDAISPGVPALQVGGEVHGMTGGGGAGGVGLVAIQLARAPGAQVYPGAGSHNHDFNFIAHMKAAPVECRAQSVEQYGASLTQEID
jgi:NADPH:quinone reductase-like Zn-dependent oxidoreductase